MKRAVFGVPLLLTVVGLCLAGCSSERKGKPVYVAPTGAVQAPHPPPTTEGIVGAPPGSKLTWRDGYWVFANWRWVWIPGYWEENRPGTAPWTWVPGQWDRRGGNWHWQPGKWVQQTAAE